MKRKQKKILVVLVMTLVLGALFIPIKSKAASSGKWSVYYVSNGGSGERYTVPISVYDDGYNAKCSSISGTCTSRKVSIVAYADAQLKTRVLLNKNVNFTTVSSLKFNTATVPSVKTLYFRVILTHENGNTASSTGTISINN